MDSEEVSDQESILSEDDNKELDQIDQDMASAGDEESKVTGLGDVQVSQ